jgi:ribosomal protein S18 acetylase RimI-like enzyme
VAETSAVIRQPLQFETVPLAEVDALELESLLDEEVNTWQKILHWDYRRTADLIQQYAGSALIPGVALRSLGRVVGYGYYLLRAPLGSIGGIFASPSRTEPALAGAYIFSNMFGELVSRRDCRRIEGQLFTLTHSWEDTLLVSGLAPHQRFYMGRDLQEPAAPPTIQLCPWENDFLPAAANLLFSAYQCHLDSEISVSYSSVNNCLEFLRNIVLVPGCGEFLCEPSAVFLDPCSAMAGFILLSRISANAALIPQICVRPDLHGKGIGGGLLEYACARLKENGFRRLFLCVTASNEPARRLYLRHGFHDIQNFSAFFWERQ